MQARKSFPYNNLLKKRSNVPSIIDKLAPCLYSMRNEIYASFNIDRSMRDDFFVRLWIIWLATYWLIYLQNNKKRQS